MSIEPVTKRNLGFGAPSNNTQLRPIVHSRSRSIHPSASTTNVILSYSFRYTFTDITVRVHHTHTACSFPKPDDDYQISISLDPSPVPLHASFCSNHKSQIYQNASHQTNPSRADEQTLIQDYRREHPRGNIDGQGETVQDELAQGHRDPTQAECLVPQHREPSHLFRSDGWVLEWDPCCRGFQGWGVW